MIVNFSIQKTSGPTFLTKNLRTQDDSDHGGDWCMHDALMVEQEDSSESGSEAQVYPAEAPAPKPLPKPAAKAKAKQMPKAAPKAR